jgi:hypothetical protein
MSIPTPELLRYCRTRLRQLYPAGNGPRLPELARMTVAERMVEASRSDGRLVARAQADIFAEIIRFALCDMDEDMHAAPYLLQAWTKDGAHHYYFSDGSWLPTHEGAKQYPSFFEAEAFIQQNFDPNDARDGILVVPLSEVEKHA